MNGSDQALLRAHRARYPQMTAQDCVKLFFQNEFGPMHLVEDKDELMRGLAEEWQAVPNQVAPAEPESIGGGLCRFPLRPEAFSQPAAKLLAGLVLRTAQSCSGNAARLRERLERLSAEESDLRLWLEEHDWDFASPVGHSARFRTAYHPHYRLLRREYAGYYPLLLQIAEKMQQKQPLLIAIDGRCGSGKTQLAALLQALFPCRVFHTDHYYLPIAQRPVDWQQRAAGNMDLERLRAEVVQPAHNGESICQRVFNCASQHLQDPQIVPPAPLTVVEGSYSLHPALNGAYDMRIFLTCSDAMQTVRLQAREGDYYDMFRRVWIPMEELYYAKCRPLQTHPVCVDTTSFFRESVDSLSI